MAIGAGVAAAINGHRAVGSSRATTLATSHGHPRCGLSRSARHRCGRSTTVLHHPRCGQIALIGQSNAPIAHAHQSKRVQTGRSPLKRSSRAHGLSSHARAVRSLHSAGMAKPPAAGSVDTINSGRGGAI